MLLHPNCLYAKHTHTFHIILSFTVHLAFDLAWGADRGNGRSNRPKSTRAWGRPGRPVQGPSKKGSTHRNLHTFKHDLEKKHKAIDPADTITIFINQTVMGKMLLQIARTVCNHMMCHDVEVVVYLGLGHHLFEQNLSRIRKARSQRVALPGHPTAAAGAVYWLCNNISMSLWVYVCTYITLYNYRCTNMQSYAI